MGHLFDNNADFVNSALEKHTAPPRQLRNLIQKDKCFVFHSHGESNERNEPASDSHKAEGIKQAAIRLDSGKFPLVFTSEEMWP